MALVLFEEPVPGSELYWDDELEFAWVTHKGETHDEEQARLNIEATRRLNKTRGIDRVRTLVDIRRIRAVTREARALYASEESAQTLSVVALVIGSSTSRVLANFFMALNKPKTPTRVFTDTEAAVAWLGEHRNE